MQGKRFLCWLDFEREYDNMTSLMYDLECIRNLLSK